MNYRCKIFIESREWRKRIITGFGSKSGHVDKVPLLSGVLANKCLESLFFSFVSNFALDLLPEQFEVVLKFGRSGDLSDLFGYKLCLCGRPK